MPFVSITRLRVRSWRYLPGFLIQSFRAARQAKRATGSSVGVRSSAMPTATAFPALLLAGFGRAPRAALALAVGFPVSFAVAFLAAVIAFW